MTRIARSTSRAGVVGAIALVALMLAPASAFAFHPIGHTGSPGLVGITDTFAEPGAKCSYVGGGAAGTTHLTGIKMRHGPTISGIHSGLRSVGYQPIIQKRHGGAWVNVKRGTLVTGQASTHHAVDLPPERTALPASANSPTKYRLVLKLFWYHADASVEATERIALDAYVQLNNTTDDTSCKGQVVTAN